MPLPTLVERRGILLNLLERGIHPHHSVDGNFLKQSDLKPLRNEEASGSYRSMAVQSKRKTLFDKVAIPVVVSLLVITAIIVGSVVGTTMHRRHCPNDMTGARCNLSQCFIVPPYTKLLTVVSASRRHMHLCLAPKCRMHSRRTSFSILTTESQHLVSHKPFHPNVE